MKVKGSESAISSHNDFSDREFLAMVDRGIGPKYRASLWDSRIQVFDMKFDNGYVA
jgi:hypothetical protein